MYKKVYISTVDTSEIAEKEVIALSRCGHVVGIEEVVEDGEKKYKVYYNKQEGGDPL
jgi:hypothetical protein